MYCLRPSQIFITSIHFLTWKPHTSLTWRHKFKSISAISNPSRFLDSPCNRKPIEMRAHDQTDFLSWRNHRLIQYRSSRSVGSSHVTRTVKMTKCFVSRLAISRGEFIRKDFGPNSIYGTGEITVGYSCISSLYSP